jgi:hypothetical protein
VQLSLTTAGLVVRVKGTFDQRNEYAWAALSTHKTPDGGSHPAHLIVARGGASIVVAVRFPRGTLVSTYTPHTDPDGAVVQMLELSFQKGGTEVLYIRRFFKKMAQVP